MNEEKNGSKKEEQEKSDKIFLNEDIVKEIKNLNGSLSTGYARVGKIETEIDKLQKKKKMVLDEIDKVEVRISEISKIAMKTHGIAGDGNWKINFETCELVKVKK